MKNKKPRLPRGLHWKSDSPFIWFKWRDDRGKQRQSTGTDDPVQAFAFRQEFIEKQQQKIEVKCAPAEMGKWPLKKAAEEYLQLENGKQLRGDCGSGEKDFQTCREILRF